MFAAEVIRYGRYLGNQQFEPAADLSSFHVRYEDIAYRHFRAMGDIPRLCARIDASTPPHTAERIYVADMPETLRLDVSGVALEGGVDKGGGMTRLGVMQAGGGERKGIGLQAKLW